MRISGNANMESISLNRSNQLNNSNGENVVEQGSKVTISQTSSTEIASSPINVDNSEETKTKVKEAIYKLNEMLEVNNNTSKFLYHEGLDRYYVTIVDRETEEVVKEIPPKKLLDSYYEMQKMLGMIVDEKI